MAEKGDEAPSTLQNLVCPMCLDIFEDATLLTCGHTFCRKCLQRYDASHEDLDHMVCPLCRKTTKFSDKRVEGLPANVTVNGLVDEHVVDQGGMNAVLELQLQCTGCKWKEEAISFCHECNNYMCDACHQGHQRLISVFGDHRVVSVADIKSGKVSVQQETDRCKSHKNESKDLFCEECNVHMCFKCVIVGHRDHKIKNHEDFERELRDKVDDLLQRCSLKKTDLEKNIQNTELMRQEVYVSIQKLDEKVKEACEKKARHLKENERVLLEKINSLRKTFDDEFDKLKSHDRQQVKSIVNSVTLVANDRLGRLEADSLSAHSLLCEELETLLGEATDGTAAKRVKETAKRHRFQPAGEDLLDLGTCTDVRRVRVTKEITLRGTMSGMAAMPQEGVVIGYSTVQNGDFIDLAGKIERTLDNLNGFYYDITVMSDKTMAISWNKNMLQILHSTGSAKQRYITDYGPKCPRITSNHDNELILSNGADKILTYDSSASTLKCTISTENKSMQAFETRSGAVVSSSCDASPSVITVYDRTGKTGSSLSAKDGEYLYATVDSEDRVYLATVNPSMGRVWIKLYDVQGLILEEIAKCAELKLPVPNEWCYLVSVSPTMLAFASGKKLYFIEVDA